MGWGRVFFFVLFSIPLYARSPILLGHNLTPTSYLLADGETTVGTYALGYGVHERLTLATSPWLIINYNMPAVLSRFLLAESADHRWSFEFNYFKTFSYLFDLYDQESVWMRSVWTARVSPGFALHTSVGWQRYYNDSRAYSMRLTVGRSDPTTLSLSTLAEIALTARWGVFLEAGVLGLNYKHPYWHLGASAYYRWSWGLLQAGLSRSTMFGPYRMLVTPEELGGDRPSAVLYDEEVGRYYSVLASFHPEMQFQTFF